MMSISMNHKLDMLLFIIYMNHILRMMWTVAGDQYGLGMLLN